MSALAHGRTLHPGVSRAGAAVPFARTSHLTPDTPRRDCAMSHASPPSPEKATADTAFRFVHCADVHLDSPFRCASDDVRARLHDAGRATFLRLVDMCLDERVHALLIAGDLFDDEQLTFATEEFLLAQLARLSVAGIHVVIACGNHDSGELDGRAARLTWPAARITLVTGHEPQEIAITARDGSLVGRVIACGHADDHDTENLAALFPAASGSVPTVGLLHARVAEALGMERHPAVAPCTLADLAAPGYRYWALGHVHRRQELRAADAAAGAGPLACYAGTLIGHHCGETGARGALLVSVPPRGAVTAEFRPLALARWETLDVPGLDTIADLAALGAAIGEAFTRLAGDDASMDAHADTHDGAHTGADDDSHADTRDGAHHGAHIGANSGAHVGAHGRTRWMLRVELSGDCPAAAELQRDEVLEELAEEITADLAAQGVLSVELIECGVHRPVGLDSHRGQPHVLGLSLEVIDALAGDDELLARLAPSALAGNDGRDEAAKRAYLRSLLTGIDSAAGEALLKETNA
jgi:DNA repair protein SbcD/Mre11